MNHIDKFKNLMESHPEALERIQFLIREFSGGKSAVAAPAVVTYVVEKYDGEEQLVELFGESGVNSQLGIAIYQTLNREDNWKFYVADKNGREIKMYYPPAEQ